MLADKAMEPMSKYLNQHNCTVYSHMFKTTHLENASENRVIDGQSAHSEPGQRPPCHEQSVSSGGRRPAGHRIPLTTWKASINCTQR